MLTISSKISIADEEIDIHYIRAQGAGGQNVNKVASAAHLRFDIKHSSLSETIKQRLLAMSDRRISADGVLVIKAQRYRDQAKNRADALERMKALIIKATGNRKKRIATKPSKNAQRKRINNKTHRGKTKILRGKPKLEH